MGRLTRIRKSAAASIDQNHVEDGWYLYGMADGIEGIMDPEQAADALYGEFYRKGYEDHKR